MLVTMQDSIHIDLNDASFHKVPVTERQGIVELHISESIAVSHCVGG